MMDRQTAIKKLQQIGAKIAEQMGYTEMVVGEDRCKGIWGETLTKHLEEKYGECTKEINWFKENKPEDLHYGDNISFDFRFANPRLSIDHRKVDGSFASIELSDFSSREYTKYEKAKAALGENPSREEKSALEKEWEARYRTGNFKVKEIQVFEGDDNRGMEFLQILLDAWNNA